MNRLPAYETWPSDPSPPPMDEDANLFLDAEIRPNRSLPNVGFYALMGAVMVISFTAGIAFMMIGAWPILGFFGLDVILVWLAFRLSYRDGRRREHIKINTEEIRVSRISAFGHHTEFRLPLGWTRMELVKLSANELQARLIHRGKTLIIGAMLSPAEREDLAEAVKTALQKAQTAPLP